MTTSGMASSGKPLVLDAPLLALRLASLVGQRELRRMLDDGLPASFAAACSFLLTGQVRPEDEHVLRKIEALRAALASRENEFVNIFSGTNPPEKSSSANRGSAKSALRSLAQVAHISSVLPHWGMFLYLCADALRARTIIELGSSAGISGCYLASGRYCQRFITVEGSTALAQLAEGHLRQVSNHFEVLSMPFNEALDEIFPSLGAGIDMAYIDGGKEKSANLHYVERLVPHLNIGGVLVLDDIRWSSEMWAAWQTIRRRKGFAYTLTVGRFGLCIWSGGEVEPKRYALYNVAGVDLYAVKQFIENVKMSLRVV